MVKSDTLLLTHNMYIRFLKGKEGKNPGKLSNYISLPNVKNLFCQTQKLIIFINYLWNIKLQI